MRCIWLLCLSIPLCAQTVDISSLGTGTVSLAGQWRFQPGDNPRWADPNFDDSGWKRVKVPLTLNKQGYLDFKAFGWYRLRILWKEGSRPPDLVLNSGSISFVGEFFANNASIGRTGSFPPRSQVYNFRPILFTLDHNLWTSEGQLLLAVRVWKDPKFASQGYSGFDETAPEIGFPATMQSNMDAADYALLKAVLPNAAVRCIELILGIYLLALACTKTGGPEYLWLGLAFCVDVSYNAILWIFDSTRLLTGAQCILLLDLTDPLFYMFLAYGLWAVFHAKIGRPFQLFLVVMLVVMTAHGAMYAEFGRWRLEKTPFDPLLWMHVAAHLIILIFLLRRFSSRFGEVRWLAISFFVILLASLFELLQSLIPSLRDNDGWSDAAGQIALAGGIVALSYLLMRRFSQAQAEGERLRTEMGAAQEIQSLLLPARLPSTPGFNIETAYLPAQEVGGDFFQITTVSDGSLLIAIGDVSGKGLRAALTVSLVVGLWKEITANTFSPADILLRLNRQLGDSVEGGFVTCLCARLTPDGHLTFVNAGHLAPYWNGKEMITENGLPLGITAQSDYEESHYLLSPNDTLIFISDGVVEARDKARNLFGFERLQQVLAEHPGAEAIARRAQQFGQEDDITVISVSRQAMIAEPAVRLQSASLAV